MTRFYRYANLQSAILARTLNIPFLHRGKKFRRLDVFRYKNDMGLWAYRQRWTLWLPSVPDKYGRKLYLASDIEMADREYATLLGTGREKWYLQRGHDSVSLKDTHIFH